MNTTININDSFFKGVYKEVWRKLVPSGLTDAEVDFIESVAQLKANATVLDLMCGYGRHTLELAKRGYNVTAIDNLPDYINEIEQASGDSQVYTQLNSLIEMHLNGIFDAIICMGNSFSFFSKEEAQSILHQLATHMHKDSVFIINTWMLGEIAIRHFKEKEWFYAGEFKYLHDCAYYFHPSRIESEHTIIAPDGRIEVNKGVDYIFTIPELQAMMLEAGLSIEGIYSTPRKRPFKIGDTRAYIVVCKQ